ncbi:hypothetical protein [Brevundimonas sp. SORGH_AS_0993]|uniref:hypothetical protein n=1 Tax=Brevundimonas sp. SORGH_AS_0993 TaxID=3041794 RepID=UPI00277FA212|nr:hypothetical protein [Brevundimonas sp. SORGH_AS_0993]MDQ1154149.1 hypothetical protein [Brevundimonas sp. SORGH_AS_0993]
MKDRLVGVRVARQLRTAEHAIDQAMVEVCRLIQTSLEGRVESRLAAEVGQSALESIVAGLGQLTTVRASVVAGHADLATVAEDHGIGWRLEGVGEDKGTRPTAALPAEVVQLAA